MSGFRRAALCLYALDIADQEWLLQKLSEPQRERLQQMLQELTQMGVPKDQKWFPDLVQESSSELTEQSYTCDETQAYIRQIDKAHPDQIAKILDHEPVSVVTPILSQRVWAWRQAYLSIHKAHKHQHLLHNLERTSQAIKPKVSTALLTALAKRLDIEQRHLDCNKEFDAVLSDSVLSEATIHQPRSWKRLWRR